MTRPTTRRDLLAAAAALSVPGGPRPARACEPAPADATGAPPDALGGPAIEILVGPRGIAAPAALPAGPTRLTLVPDGAYAAGLVVARPPVGLAADEADAALLAGGRRDLALPGWYYAGGIELPSPGVPASVVVELRPGAYRLAASWYGDGPEAGDHRLAAPLVVARPAAGPEARAAAASADERRPRAAVRLEVGDGRAALDGPAPLPAGPLVWEIANAGPQRARRVALLRVPDGTAAERLAAELDGSIGDGGRERVLPRAVPVGATALQSAGASLWTAFDLAPATYAAVCMGADPADGAPFPAAGRVAVFAVA